MSEAGGDVDEKKVFTDCSRVNIPFHLPANFLVAGESNSGKSTWVENLIKYKDVMLDPPPAKILVFYRQKQQIYEQWEEKYPYTTCHEGIQHEILNNLPLATNEQGGMGTLLVLDDLMTETVADKKMIAVFTAGRHHNLQGIVSVWHNIFPRQGRTLGLNMHTYALMRSPRIGSQVPTLGSQLGHRKQIGEAYKMATMNKPFSSLIVDFSDKQNPNAWTYALRSNIWPSDPGHTEVFANCPGLIGGDSMY